MRKALFKRGLERNCKNKNVLEFDVKKDGGFKKKKISSFQTIEREIQKISFSYKCLKIYG